MLTWQLDIKIWSFRERSGLEIYACGSRYPTESIYCNNTMSWEEKGLRGWALPYSQHGWGWGVLVREESRRGICQEAACEFQRMQTERCLWGHVKEVSWIWTLGWVKSCVYQTENTSVHFLVSCVFVCVCSYHLESLISFSKPWSNSAKSKNKYNKLL